MEQLVAALFAGLCLYLIVRFRWARDIVDVQLAVIGAFSIGYFCLPVWFDGLSGLKAYPENEVTEALGIFFAFALFVVIGTWIGRRASAQTTGWQTPKLDAVFARHRKVIVCAAFAWYLYYYFTNELTSYASSNLSTYFQGGGALSGLIATSANLALAIIALGVSLALREGQAGEFFAYTVMLLTTVALLLLVGQRLAFLSPIFMVLAALALTGQIKSARRILILGVVALALVSPVAVAVREAPPKTDAITAIETFKYGEHPAETIFQSIIDRGDLLYVTINMKPRIDAEPLPGATYYASVIVNPIPSAVYPGGSKPYLLSVNGQPSGELSIYAWDKLHGGGPGSLTAFGGVVAYREFRWPGVVLNGLLTGMLFVLLARKLGAGGYAAMAAFAQLFVDLSVKKVPPSLWEAISALMPLIPFLVALFILERLLPSRTDTKVEPSSTKSSTASSP